MKLTVISDIHAELDRLTLAAPVLADSDALIVSGDLTCHGNTNELRDVIRRLQEIQPVVTEVKPAYVPPAPLVATTPLPEAGRALIELAELPATSAALISGRALGDLRVLSSMPSSSLSL